MSGLYPVIKDVILVIVNNVHQVDGIKHLAIDLLGCTNVAHVRQQLNLLQDEKQIEVIQVKAKPGRGDKAIIRKVNPNSPGYPRTR